MLFVYLGILQRFQVTVFNEHVTLLMDISLVSACPPYAEVADITACKIRSFEMPLSDNCSRWHRM